MSKLTRDTQLRLGEERLQEWGVAASASDAAANVDALRRCIGRDPAADLAIAARLGTHAVAASVSALQVLEAAPSDKLVRKEVRRSLYRLQQRGVEIPRRSALAPVRVAPAPVPLEGYLSAVDGRGDQLVWLTKPQPGGLAHLFAVVNDPDGLLEVNLFETSRKALRASREELLRRHELRMVEADWRYCDYLIDRALHWAIEQHRSVGGDYPGLRAQLTKEPVTGMPPLIFTLLDAEAVRGDPQLVRDGDALLEEREFRTWMFDDTTLQPYIDEFNRIKDSPVLLTEVQQEERVRAVTERAVEELFGGTRQRSWVRRLQEMAYFFHVTARARQAKQALATALALEASPRGGRDIPFCEVLARGSLAVCLHQGEEQEEEQARGSLVITPQQAAREARWRQ